MFPFLLGITTAPRYSIKKPLKSVTFHPVSPRCHPRCPAAVHLLFLLSTRCSRCPPAVLNVLCCPRYFFRMWWVFEHLKNCPQCGCSHTLPTIRHNVSRCCPQCSPAMVDQFPLWHALTRCVTFWQNEEPERRWNDCITFLSINVLLLIQIMSNI